jgi:hypothetical protein
MDQLSSEDLGSSFEDFFPVDYDPSKPCKPLGVPVTLIFHNRKTKTSEDAGEKKKKTRRETRRPRGEDGERKDLNLNRRTTVLQRTSTSSR